MSISQERVDRLITAIHTAPLERNGWHDVARQLCDAIGAERAVMLRMGATPQDQPWTLPLEFDPDALANYAAHWAPHDLLLIGAQAMGRVAAGVVSTDEQVIDRRAYLSSAYFNEFLRSADVERQINVCLSAPDPVSGSGPSAVTLYRGVGKAPFDRDEAALLGRLSPHLTLAARTTWKLEAAALIDATCRGALDAVRIPAFAIDSIGRITFMNRAAEATLSAGHWVTSRQGYFAPAASLRGPDRARVHGAVARLRLGLASTFLLNHPISNAQTVLTAVPLARQSAFPELSHGVVGVVWLIACAADPAPSRALARLFGMTRAEERLLRRLMAGDDLQAAAAVLGLSVHTVRNQLKSIFHRTGRRTQSQLLAFAGRLAAIQLQDATTDLRLGERGDDGSFDL